MSPSTPHFLFTLVSWSRLPSKQVTRSQLLLAEEAGDMQHLRRPALWTPQAGLGLPEGPLGVSPVQVRAGAGLLVTVSPPRRTGRNLGALEVLALEAHVSACGLGWPVGPCDLQ